MTRDKLCSIPGCSTKHYGQLEGQASWILYTLDSTGAIEHYPVCSVHYAMALGMQGVYESEHEALAQRKAIEL